MKRLLFIMAMVATVALAGCAAKGANSSNGGDRLRVAAGFYTMADFTAKIAGDRAEVTTLVPAGVEPHDWEPTAKDIAALRESDLLVLNGSGFEHWAEDIGAMLGEGGPVVLETSEGLALLESGDEGADDHEDVDSDDHEDEDEHEHDPHVWLDPMNAKAQMTAIHDALVALDPDGAAYYSENLSRWADECDRLDREYRDALEPLPGRDIVVAHEAFGYLCARYGLRQISASGLSPDGEPDPARMAGVIDYAAKNKVRVIFFEQLTSPKVAQTIAREIGAETAVLSPIEGLDAAEEAAGADYFSLMRDNLERLVYALE